MEYVVYVLEETAGKKYIGLTSDLSKRLKEHNSGKSLYTKRSNKWKIIWYSKKLSLREARVLERKMKKQKGGDGIKLLLSEYRGS